MTQPEVRTLYRGAALADGHARAIVRDRSLLVEDGRIVWIRPSDDEPDPGRGTRILDVSGCTAVPGMVDAHSHLTLPGGAHWIERIDDAPERLVEEAEHNAVLLRSAGVRWARDVGAPRRIDPVDGRERALSLGVRDRWRGRAGYPHVRAAGTWVSRRGVLPDAVAVDVDDADGLRAAVLGQLDDRADLVKLYLDGPDPDAAPWTVDELRPVVDAVHERGAKVTAHATRSSGSQLGAEAGVDAIEHGSQIEPGTAGLMAARGVALVSTLTVFASWRSFGATTTIPRFTDDDGVAKVAERFRDSQESLRNARAAGVHVAAGTDFGGGSARANQLPWEVELMVDAGLEPHDALAAVTWRGGALLGEPDAGVIREGGPADLVFVHGDPLTDPSALWRVWRVSWATGSG